MIIFDGLYGSSILSSLLSTLGNTMEEIGTTNPGMYGMQHFHMSRNPPYNRL